MRPRGALQQEEPFSRARCRPSERVGAGSGRVCARARAHVHAHPHLHTRFPQQCSAPKPSELSPVCTAVPTPVPRLRGSSAPPRRTATATHASGEGSRRHSRLAGVGNNADFVFPVRNPNGKSLPAFPCLRRPRSCWRRAAGCALAAVPCASLCPGAPLSMPTQLRVLCCGLVLPPPAACGREKAITPPPLPAVGITGPLQALSFWERSSPGLCQGLEERVGAAAAGRPGAGLCAASDGARPVTRAPSLSSQVAAVQVE